MTESGTWRILLGQLIQQGEQRQKLADDLGVNPVTLMRWVKGISNPQAQNISRLLSLLPERKRLEMLSLVVLDFPDYSYNLFEDAREDEAEIPSTFYATVLQMLTTSSKPQGIWAVRKLILQHAFDHLDPQCQNVAVMMAQCVPPGNKNSVRSLYSVMGVGVSPWQGELDHRRVFLGAETVPGQAISSGHPATIQNTRREWMERPEGDVGIASITAYPILRDDHVAGTFGAISTQADYWHASRLTLIEHYTALLSLTFVPQDFYPLKDIVLAIMPPPLVQLPHLDSFRERVNALLKEALSQEQLMTVIQAEQLVWQQMEEELIQMAFSKR